MLTPVINSLGFAYERYDLSHYDLTSINHQNLLLAKAANKEIDGDKSGAELIYSQLESHAEATAHLKRIATDNHFDRPQQILNLATVAEEHGSVGTAFLAYSELLLQSQDAAAYTTASQRLTQEKFKGFITHGR